MKWQFSLFLAHWCFLIDFVGEKVERRFLPGSCPVGVDRSHRAVVVRQSFDPLPGFPYDEVVLPTFNESVLCREHSEGGEREPGDIIAVLQKRVQVLKAADF